MKKKIKAILISFSLMTTSLMQAALEPLRFKDKPALTARQKKMFSIVKVLIAFEGAMLGGFAGLSLYELPLGLKYKPTGGRRFLDIQRQGPEEMANTAGPSRLTFTEVEKRHPLEFGVPGAVLGSFALYYPLTRLISPILFAYWNSMTSYRIAKICLYYDINIGQYRTILTAAEKRKKEGLLAAINELYPKRFGADWQNRMKTLFATYKTQAQALITKGSFAPGLSEDERDFVRMVELGAAMANLYYGTKPDRKKALDEAEKLYQELNFL